MHQPPRLPFQRDCVICQQPLSVHRRAVADTCQRAACQQQRLRQQLQQRSDLLRQWGQQAVRWQQQWAARQTPHCDAPHIDAPGVEPPLSADPAPVGEQTAWPVAVLPANERRLSNLPEKRRRRFREHLLRVVSEGAARHASHSPPTDDEPGMNLPAESAAVSLLPVLGNACGTCRGYCCHQGGEHAFLHPETMRRHLDQRPGIRPAQLVELYLSYLGPKTYAGACVYQAGHGCLLPRELRSPLCNRYLCRGLEEFLAQLSAAGTERGIALATTEHSLLRTHLLDGDQVHVLPPAPDSSSEPSEAAPARGIGRAAQEAPHGG